MPRLTAGDGAVTVSDDDDHRAPRPQPIRHGSLASTQRPEQRSHFVTYAGGRLDGTVNFDWASAAPAAGVTADNFSVRWTGRVQAPVNGSYTFTTIADDGVRLWVNGQLVVDNWVDQSAATRSSAPIPLVGGNLYDLKLEYYEHGGLATAKLLWAYPGRTQSAIPQSQLYPPANRALTVNAGPDRTITLLASTSLTGSASDDGQPSPPARRRGRGARSRTAP